MTIAELIATLSKMDQTRLVCIQHPNDSRGYYPAGDKIRETIIGRGFDGENHASIVLELVPWPTDDTTEDDPNLLSVRCPMGGPCQSDNQLECRRHCRMYIEDLNAGLYDGLLGGK